MGDEDIADTTPLADAGKEVEDLRPDRVEQDHGGDARNAAGNAWSLRCEPGPARPQLPLKDDDLVPQREDFHVLAPVAHRQQPAAPRGRS
ncbi:hypothetical protein AB0N06_36830 [Streptomyces sp. NPDC051020]|uniref:hypothetical protein n=1 Tax=Streptomyces sp. NPDC051020 TaxID=3155409 RepID=UPI00342161A6